MKRIVIPTSVALFLIVAFSDAAGLASGTTILLIVVVSLCALLATAVSIFRTPRSLGRWLFAAVLVVLFLLSAALWVLDQAGLQ